jgi:hypothetical protein
MATCVWSRDGGGRVEEGGGKEEKKDKGTVKNPLLPSVVQGLLN